ncbi:SMC-Scp complex subunit ScpB [Catellatospora methionotrophica]|uniref:SMC-Scp complex subunit ScpB n=1 Tax=Catellatospora methionotrophica TaxID=121620 RepID=UPI0033F19562
MTDNESLEQQAASWVPPWARTPAPEEGKGSFLTDSVEEGHLPIAEVEADADAERSLDAGPAQESPAADSPLDCGPDDLAGPLDADGLETYAPAADEPDAEDLHADQPDADQPDADQPDAAQPDADQPDAAQPDAGEPDADQPDASEPAFSQAVASEPASREAEALVEELPLDQAMDLAVVDVVVEPVHAAHGGPVAEDEAADEAEDVAEIAVVEDLAEALGLDGSAAARAFDVDGADDSGEAAVAYAGSKLATPPPGLAEADLVPTLEAILLVVDEPVSELTLAEVLDVPAELIAGTLIDLSASYTRQNRGFDLRRAAGGWRLYTRAEFAPYVERFVLDGQQLRLTQASLETLAVVAYKQPVTRSRISAIRGVNCDGVIRTLVTRGMIEECGTEPESGAFLYRTTSLFLEKLGLDSVGQLPPLAPFLPDNVEEIADEQR